MNFPLLVARRYFFSKYKRGFINLISMISMVVVAVGALPPDASADGYCDDTSSTCTGGSGVVSFKACQCEPFGT